MSLVVKEEEEEEKVKRNCRIRREIIVSAGSDCVWPHAHYSAVNAISFTIHGQLTGEEEKEEEEVPKEPPTEIEGEFHFFRRKFPLFTFLKEEFS